MLAIDPATTTGYATQTESGVVAFTPKPNTCSRVKKFSDWLVDMLDANPAINFITYEKPGGRNYAALRTHSQLEGIILLHCAKRGLGYIGLSAGEIKKHATGKGNANKEKMVAAAKLKWPEIDIIDDNHRMRCGFSIIP